MAEFTRLLGLIEQGNEAALEQFLALVYGELRRLASGKIRREASVTLQVTELVNEAYIRLVDKEGIPLRFEGSAHFFASASEAMRRILVEHARKKLTHKRGGGKKPIAIHDSLLASPERSDEIVAVHEALLELEIHDSQVAELVKLRYFVGLPHKEAAEAMGVSKRVADRLWAVGKMWLFRKLEQA